MWSPVLSVNEDDDDNVDDVNFDDDVDNFDDDRISAVQNNLLSGVTFQLILEVVVVGWIENKRIELTSPGNRWD